MLFGYLGNLVIMPLLGSLIIGFLPRYKETLVKQVGLITSLITLVYSLQLWIYFDKTTPHFQMVENLGWFPLGIDGISVFFIILTTFLTPFCLLIGWNAIQKLVKEYVIAFLVLESMLIIVFSVLDLLYFYVFFESVLIPMFLVIGVWGSRERKIHAAYQFFLYTLIGSVVMLLAILFIYSETGTTDIQVLMETTFSERRQYLLWLAFFASFAVKVPMIPVHIWLPEAHVEAPTAGSVILAGMLLKLGTYGLIRFSLPMFPEASVYFSPLVYVMSVIGIIYASLTTIRQVDLKKIIAYSSVAHMAYVTLGLFSFNLQGMEGAVLLMLSHGIVSSALFLCVGMLYDRHGTRLLNYYGGIAQYMPIFSLFFLFFILANMSVPGTSSFVGELLVLVGIFRQNIVVAFLASTGIILGAIYSIWLYNRVVFGIIRTEYFEHFYDLDKRECVILLPFVIASLWMGIYPEVFLSVMHTSCSYVLQVFA